MVDEGDAAIRVDRNEAWEEGGIAGAEDGLGSQDREGGWVVFGEVSEIDFGLLF